MNKTTQNFTINEIIQASFKFFENYDIQEFGFGLVEQFIDEYAMRIKTTDNLELYLRENAFMTTEATLKFIEILEQKSN